MGLLDRVRAAGWRALTSGDGVIAGKVRQVNDKLGRPLASDEEIADRKAFEAGYKTGDAPAVPVAAPQPSTKVAAPVLVYFLDKQRRDVPKLTEILDQHGVPYKTLTLEDDPAALMAIRRDSHGYRLPVVFIAGECVGGRVELINIAASGELKRKVFG